MALVVGTGAFVAGTGAIVAGTGAIVAAAARGLTALGIEGEGNPEARADETPRGAPDIVKTLLLGFKID
jgi:hypothetical protein